MSKNTPRTPSVSERRKQEELRQQKARQRNMIIGGALIALLAIAALAIFLTRDEGGDLAEGTELTGDRPLATIDPALRDSYYEEAPAMTIDTDKEYQAVIVMEDGGEMRIRLLDNEAPNTVNNFVFLATQGFYDGTTFHRVIADFMAQGGDPSGTGAGGPGYSFADETDNGLTFDRRGLLAMANSGPDTNGSQFFITFAPATHLDGLHTIFGELVEGDEVLGSISPHDPGANEPGDKIAEINIIEQ